MKTSEYLKSLASSLENPSQDALEASTNDFEMEIVAEALVAAANVLNSAAEALEPTDLGVTDRELYLIACSLDATNNPELIKTANLIDQYLLSMGTSAEIYNKIKLSQDKKIDDLAKKYKDIKDQGLSEKIADAEKAIDKSPYYKEYQVMEAALSTRTCPDHAGAMMARVGDDRYQCPLDKKVYDFMSGFTLSDGSKVPGTDVANQTNMPSLIEPTFETRMERLKK